MAETSRKKKLPLAVLVAPALAFGSLTFATAPAMAVPVDEVQQILNEEGITLILVDAGAGVYAQNSEGEPFLGENDEQLMIDGLAPFSTATVDGEFFVGTQGELYPMEEFEHASSEEYDEHGLEVPEFILELENEEAEEPSEPEEPEDPTEPEEPADPEEPEEPTNPEDSEDPTEDEPEDTPESQELTVQTDFEDILPGDIVTILGSGFTPESEITITLGGDNIATAEADAEGIVEVDFEVPGDLEAGAYELVATGSVEDEVANFSFVVDEWPIDAEISQSVEEAAVGDTVRLTITNVDELIDEYVTGDDSYEIGLQGDFFASENINGLFGTEGIVPVEGEDYTFEYTIPESVETDNGTFTVEPGTDFGFYAAIFFDSEEADVEYIWSGAIVDIISDDAVTDVDPALTVEPAEITAEDFVGESEEGSGVLHTVTDVAPGTEIAYSVDTPENIEPFSSTAPALADEEGVSEFWIYGENVSDPSVYLGDYTTTVTYVDEEGQSQELTANFTVVEGAEDSVTPVVDTEDAATEDETPAVGGQLADTGANGTSLMWIAGGLLALGGAFVIYANRGRLFGRKN